MIGPLTGEGDDDEDEVGQKKALQFSPSKFLAKNVWKSDKSWEPEKIWKFENLKI